MIGTIRRAVPALAAVGAALTLTADAAAVQRFAAPGAPASGSCLTPATACQLDHVTTPAASGLQNGDEIIVAPGTYTDADLSPLGILINRAVTLRGQDGAPPPTLRSEGGMPNSTVETRENVTLRRLRIERSGTLTAALQHTRADTTLTAEELTVVTQGSPSAGISSLGGLTLRNSFVSATTAGAPAVSGVDVGVTSAVTTRIVNSTIVASGPNTTGLALSGGFVPPALVTATLVNSVVRAGTDVRVTSDGVGGAALTARHSNFRTPAVTGAKATFTDGGGNQAADPLLAADGVPQAGSPLVDAGVAEPDIGATDLAGNARNQGAAPDIGAFEAPGLLAGGSGAAPAPAPTQTPASGGGPAGPVATPLLRLTFIKPPKTVRRSALRKGLAVNVNVSGPAVVVAELTGPKRKRLARARVSAKRAGKVTLRLKARVSGRKRVAATLKVTATPAGGAATTQSRKLTIR